MSIHIEEIIVCCFVLMQFILQIFCCLFCATIYYDLFVFKILSFRNHRPTCDSVWCLTLLIQRCRALWVEACRWLSTRCRICFLRVSSPSWLRKITMLIWFLASRCCRILKYMYAFVTFVTSQQYNICILYYVIIIIIIIYYIIAMLRMYFFGYVHAFLHL